MKRKIADLVFWLLVILMLLFLLPRIFHDLSYGYELDPAILKAELNSAGYRTGVVGEKWSVPILQVELKPGSSIQQMCREVPSLNALFPKVRDAIGEFNGLNPFYTVTPGKPWEATAEIIYIPLTDQNEPDIFPKRDDLLATYETYLLIDRQKQYLALYQKGELIRVFPISTARSGKATPALCGKIKAKKLEHWSTIYDVWMPFSLLLESPFYIHGGAMPGKKDSAGCVRMFPEHARILFDLVEVGTPYRID